MSKNKVPEDHQDDTAEMYKQVQETMCKKRERDDENDDTIAIQTSLELQDYTLDEGDDFTHSAEESSSEYENQAKKRKFH